MKIKLPFTGFRSTRRLWVCLGLGAVTLAVIGSTVPSSRKLVVHEWGTFTSVQGADGELMDWRPLETLDLPKFVHNWSRPGLNRAASSQFTGNKGMMSTLQRMETPVIYFYSEEELTASVAVKFPKGMITEWYPQARQIGPASEKPSSLVSALDAGAHKVGAKPQFTFARLFPQHAVADSRIVWSDVRVLPANQHLDVAGLMPTEKSGNHYFAARETDAAFVRLNSLSTTNPAPEHEKFLFYRGVGSFATPLKVSTSADGKVTVTNTGKEPMANAFLLNVRGGVGERTSLEKLGPGGKMEFAQNISSGAGKGNPATRESFQKEISDAMQSALVGAGLFAREAEAMVKTWRESWFAEDGVRVLYILPCAWTDDTLPLEIKPKPQGLVRVMVGRAEIITPELEKGLREQLTKAKSGDAEARAAALAEIKKLGRFALPAMQRVMSKGADAQFNQFAWTLLQASAKREERGL